MVIVGDKSTHNEAGIKRRFPVTEGLTGGTQKQEGTQLNLRFENTTVRSRHRMGIE